MMSGLVFLLFSMPCFAQEFPSSVDLRPQFEEYELQAKSQGGRGTCSVFAVTGALEFELVKAGAPRGLDLSEEYVNWASHRATGRGSDGTFYDDALAGIQMYGVCEERFLPYGAEFNPTLTPSPETMMNAAQRRNISSRWIKDWDVNTGMTDEMLRQMKAEIATGHPVIIGMRWPDNADFGEDFRLKMPPEGKVFDGHSIIYVGYEENTEAPGGGWFIFRNHNGTGWGEAGTARMPYEYARLYGNDALALQVDGNWQDCSILAACNPVEFDTLKITEKVNVETGLQEMASWGAPRWLNGNQLFCNATEDGQVNFEFAVKKSGTYRINLYATRAPDYGCIEIAVNGVGLGSRQDLYAAKVMPTNCIELGEIILPAGNSIMSVSIRGKNPASGGLKAGIDCFDLIFVKGAE